MAGLALLLGVAFAAAVFTWEKRSHLPAPARVVALRTAPVKPETVVRTIRLSGVTEARNFISLLAPELGGSRSGRNRTSTASATTSSSAATASNANTSNSTGASASSSTAAASPSPAPNSSSAFQAATSRLGAATLRGSAPPAASGASAAGTPASSAANSATPASAMGSTGLGSTAGQLAGGAQGPPSTGSSGGGTDDDWQLVLQDVVAPGSKITPGQIVAEFDRQYMLVRLDDYRDSVKESDSALTTQKADLDTTRKAHDELIRSAKDALEKARLDMKTIPVLSAIDAENMRLAFDAAEAHYQQLLKETPFLRNSQDSDIRNSELDLQEAKLELKRAETNVDKMLVRAPIGGLAVMDLTWRGGDFGKIQKGDRVWAGESFMKIVDPASMVVSASVNQVDAGSIHLGARAQIHFDAYPDLTLAARVEAVGAIAEENGDRGNYVRAVPVRLRIETADPRVIPDLSVSADIEVSPPVQAKAAAPVSAVFTDHDGRPFVYLEQDARWVRRKVEVAEQNNVMAAISSGLKAGDVVALDVPESIEN